jgi:hypothetical protein
MPDTATAARIPVGTWVTIPGFTDYETDGRRIRQVQATTVRHGAIPFDPPRIIGLATDRGRLSLRSDEGAWVDRTTRFFIERAQAATPSKAQPVERGPLTTADALRAFLLRHPDARLCYAPPRSPAWQRGYAQAGHDGQGAVWRPVTLVAAAWAVRTGLVVPDPAAWYPTLTAYRLAP